MPKHKMARKSTNIDMTAMCDVAFLLLTFFMLATKFKPDEPVVVSTPSSVSQIPIPDTSIMMITVDPKDRIFFSIDQKNVTVRDNKDARRGLIEDMNEYKNLGLNKAEMDAFVTSGSIGVPFSQLKQYLGADGPTRKQFDAQTRGIPVDTAVTESNELAAWIRVARNNNPFLRICLKADAATSYPGFEKIKQTLGDMKIFRFYLITNMEEAPAGMIAPGADS